MPRFRVSDLMISLAPGQGGPGDGEGFPCELITNCGSVTFLCVENTQGCAFTENCRCTVQTCGFPSCGFCTPCTARTCGCTCTACSACSVQTCGCSVCTVHSVCTFHTLGCGLTLHCTPTFTGATTRLGPEQLSALKDELRATLDQIEAEEQRVSESMQPQTVEDVNLLEQKLNDALDELRRRREELEKRQEQQGQGE